MKGGLPTRRLQGKRKEAKKATIPTIPATAEDVTDCHEGSGTKDISKTYRRNTKENEEREIEDLARPVREPTTRANACSCRRPAPPQGLGASAGPDFYLWPYTNNP